jgi:hypothetical protein
MVSSGISTLEPLLKRGLAVTYMSPGGKVGDKVFAVSHRLATIWTFLLNC